MTLDGYTQTYDEGEISEVATDFIIEIVVGAIAFVSLIVLVLLWAWLKKNIKR